MPSNSTQAVSDARPVAPVVPTAAAVPAASLPYAHPAPANRPAAISLVCGMLLFVPFVAGIAAVVYARRGLRRAEEIGGVGAGMARAGFVLGVLNLVLSLLAAAATPMAVVQARRSAERVRCANQLRQLAIGAALYAQANQDVVPADFDAVGTVLGAGALTAVCSCPGARRHGAAAPTTLKSGAACSYVFIPPPPGVTRFAQIRNPGMTPMAFEPLANHGGRELNVVYWDGHVESHSGPAAQAMAAQLAARVAAAAPSPPATNPAPAVQE